MHKSLSASRALRIGELERRLSESEVLRKESSERAIDFEKDLTLAREERDKAYAEVGAVSGENADLILKNAGLTVKNADLEKALNEAISERDKARDISKQITAREQNTAEEWGLRTSITMAQELKDGKSNLWDLELWKKEYEEKFGPLSQDSDEEADVLPAGEEEEVSSGVPLNASVEPPQSTAEPGAEKTSGPK